MALAWAQNLYGKVTRKLVAIDVIDILAWVGSCGRGGSWVIDRVALLPRYGNSAAPGSRRRVAAEGLPSIPFLPRAA